MLGSICLGGATHATGAPPELSTETTKGSRVEVVAQGLRAAATAKLLGDLGGRVTLGGLRVDADGIVLDGMLVKDARGGLLLSARRIALDGPLWRLLLDGARPRLTISGARLRLVEDAAGRWNLPRFIRPLRLAWVELHVRDATVELRPRRLAPMKLSSLDADATLRVLPGRTTVRLHRLHAGALTGSGTIDGSPQALALRLQLALGAARTRLVGTVDVAHGRGSIEARIDGFSPEILSNIYFMRSRGSTTGTSPFLSSGRITLTGGWRRGRLHARLGVRDLRGYGGGVPFRDGRGDGVLDGGRLTLTRFDARIPGGALSGSGHATLDGALWLDFQVRPDGHGRLPRAPAWAQLLLRAGQSISSPALIEGHVEKRPRHPARLSYRVHPPRPTVVEKVQRALTHSVPRFVTGLL